MSISTYVDGKDAPNDNPFTHEVVQDIVARAVGASDTPTAKMLLPRALLAIGSIREYIKVAFNKPGPESMFAFVVEESNVVAARVIDRLLGHQPRDADLSAAGLGAGARWISHDEAASLSWAQVYQMHHLLHSGSTPTLASMTRRLLDRRSRLEDVDDPADSKHNDADLRGRLEQGDHAVISYLKHEVRFLHQKDAQNAQSPLSSRQALVRRLMGSLDATCTLAESLRRAAEHDKSALAHALNNAMQPYVFAHRIFALWKSRCCRSRDVTYPLFLSALHDPQGDTEAHHLAQYVIDAFSDYRQTEITNWMHDYTSLRHFADALPVTTSSDRFLTAAGQRTVRV